MSIFESILGTGSAHAHGLFSAANQYRTGEQPSGSQSQKTKQSFVARKSAAAAKPEAILDTSEEVGGSSKTSKRRKLDKQKAPGSAVPAEVLQPAENSTQLERQQRQQIVADEQMGDKKKLTGKKRKTEANPEEPAVDEPAADAPSLKPRGKRKTNKKEVVVSVTAAAAPLATTEKAAALLESGTTTTTDKHEVLEPSVPKKRQKISREDQLQHALLVEPVQPGEEEGITTLQPGLKPPVRKTPEEEAEQLQRTIFVGNLPAKLKRKQLSALFSQYGTVESTRLRSVPIKLDKKLPRRAAILGKRISEDRGTSHGYVVFKDAASVAPALQHNMQEVQGLHIRVDRASKPSAEKGGAGIEYDRASSIFIGNLAFNVEDEDVIRMFNTDTSAADSVAAVRIIRDPETNIGKGFGFVLFSSKAGARMALAKDGSELKGRPIRVTRVAVSGRGSAAKSAREKPVSNLGRLQGPGKRVPGSKSAAVYGAVRRLKESAPLASWQGMQAKGAGKVVRPAAARAPKQPRADPGTRSLKKNTKQAGGAGKGSRATGKRPAVVARKARALGLPVPKVTTAKEKERKKKAGRR